MDAVERAIWQDVVLQENDCWRWKGASDCSVIRLLAELGGKPLPVNTRLYRMPECQLGKECVNPEHVGTSEQWVARISGKRRSRQ